ncbi:MAG: dicarboxylate/amino acid:cation symporter [Novosphingobium sp.]
MLPVLIIASLVLGLTGGAVLRGAMPSAGATGLIDAFDVIGTMWINAIRMTVIPLIVPLLIASIAGSRSSRAAGRLGSYTLGAFLGLIGAVAILAAVAAPVLFGGLHIDPAMTAALRTTIESTPVPSGDAGMASWLKALIPTNPVKAASDGAMLSIIVFAAAFGFATLSAPQDVRSRVVQFCHTLSAVMLLMVQAVLLIAPLGIFALALVVGARLGGTVFVAMSYFVAVQLLAMLVFVVAMLALAIFAGRIAPQTAIRGATPPLLVAAGTSSSLSALPAMIEAARDDWKLPERVYGFTLPLAVATFKPTSGYSWVFNVFFIAILFGIPFGPAKLALAAGYATLFNATIPGIPGGGMIAITPMLLALGLPVEGLAVVIAVNPIVDRFTTIGNVAADLAVTAVLARPADRD